MLILLFPRLQSIYGNLYYGDKTAEEWAHEARVCSAQKFDRYFQLALSKEELSESEIVDLIASTAKGDDFLAIMSSFSERDLMGAAMQILDSYKQKIPIGNAAEFLPAIIELADHLPDHGEFMSPTVRASRVVHWYLKLEDDPSKRGELLIKAFKKSSGVDLIGSIISNDESCEKKGETQNCAVDKASRDILRQLWLDKLRVIAAEPLALLTTASPTRVLYRWLDWGEPDEVKRWAEKNITAPQIAIRFLVALSNRGTTQTIGDRVARVIWRINVDLVIRLIDPEHLEKLISQICPDTLLDDERRAYASWQTELQRRREGKTGDQDFDD